MRVVFLGNFGVDYSSENHHKRSIEALGHEVIALQEGVTESKNVYDIARDSDLFVWVHTHGWETRRSEGFGDMSAVLSLLKAVKIPTITYHLDLWKGLAREKDLESDDFYKHIGHFFTADRLMAEWFSDHTDVKGHYLPAGVFGEECYNAQPQPDGIGNDVIFVGSKGYHPEWTWRPELIDWLKDTYGDRFTHIGGDGEIPTTRGAALNQLYANSKVVVGDSLVLGFDYPSYWSDRVYETIGRGGFLLMPEITGLDKEFDPNTELPTFKFGDFADLKKNIDFYLENERIREVVKANAFNKVINNYTYKHRWQTIFKELGL